MPTLDWIGKKAVVNHHRQVPFRLLQERPELSVGDPAAGNLLVQGDNLLALKALLPHYAGKVKCIYIDPPYNTGNEGWVYNDAVNSPEIRRWLGRVVGPEAQDLSRHDKWLCMMYPRLALLREFLSEDGAIFVSIDDNEFPRLRMLMDEFFGSSNMLATFIWQTEGNFDNQAKVKVCHEYILAYCKRLEAFPEPETLDPNVPEHSKLRKDEIVNTIVKNGPKNPPSYLVIPAGFPAAFKEGVIRARTNVFPKYEEDVVVRDYRVVSKCRAYSGWSSRKIFESFVSSGFTSVPDSQGKPTIFRITATGAIEAVKPRLGAARGHVISVVRNVGTTNQSRLRLKKWDLTFPFPKPEGLIRYLVSLVVDKHALVLDSFAGSGTSGEAVLRLNREDGGSRRFVLIEHDKAICETIARKRLECSIIGPNDEPALGGGFQYCTLGEPLFDEAGSIRSAVTFEELAAHVFFTETGAPVPQPVNASSPLLGSHEGKAVYLLFNGVLGDRRPAGGNVLTGDILRRLPAFDGVRVVYGEGCRLGADRLRHEGVVFRQIPYEIKVS